MSVRRECSVDADCAVAAHVVDCCGSIVLIGIRASEKARFEKAERACNPMGGKCECAEQPPVTEGGKRVRDPQEAWASCLANRCTALVP